MPDDVCPGFRRRLAGLLVFSGAFGYVEAAIVADLKTLLYEPAHQNRYEGRSPHALFPLLRLDDLAVAEPAAPRLFAAELVREAATVVMLGAMAAGLTRSFSGWLGAFALAFGVWDAAYYAALLAITGWPTSAWEWDLLFLVPVPWASPVLAPLIVSASLIAAGLIAFRRDVLGRPLRIRPGEWAALVAGGALLILSFCYDHRRWLAGSSPDRFPWPLFITGEAVGLAGFTSAFWANRALKLATPPRP